MNPSRWLAVALSLLAVLAVVLLLREPAAAQNNAARAKWEYKVVYVSHKPFAKGMEDDLNKLGEDGWELVGTVSRIEDRGGNFGGMRSSAEVIFKRSKQ